MTVTVYLDGAPRLVPNLVDCAWAFRGVLGLAHGQVVVLDHRPGSDRLRTLHGWREVEALHGWHFSEGDHYQTIRTMQGNGPRGSFSGAAERPSEEGHKAQGQEHSTR